MPPPAPGKETLLSGSQVLLYGREVSDLEVKQTAGVHNPFIGTRPGCNNFLESQLTCNKADAAKKPRFARIYGFAYEGAYFDLPWPALFLVQGAGEAAELAADSGGNKRFARAPDDPSRGGVGARDYELADNMKVWSFDRADFSIRMDVESGTIEQVLLDMVFGGGAGVSGARVSGARVSGARVSGARVSGARVSGARVSGARVSGARVGGDD